MKHTINILQYDEYHFTLSVKVKVLKGFTPRFPSRAINTNKVQKL